MSRIYVASSWRNEFQPHIVKRLRSEGHEVYDFRNPPLSTGFSWSEVGMPQKPTVNEYIAGLHHPRAAQGYLSDMRAMQWADVGLLVLPCGRSAHLELGWMAGRGKRTIIMTRDGEEPELMALMADHITDDIETVVSLLK
jgi:hypothetical protein